MPRLSELDEWKLAAGVEAGLRRKAHAEIERLRCAIEQIKTVCDDNAAASCNQAMALTFVRSVADEALNH